MMNPLPHIQVGTQLFPSQLMKKNLKHITGVVLEVKLDDLWPMYKVLFDDGSVRWMSEGNLMAVFGVEEI